MMRSMYSAVSGLKTHQTKMDVIGNNIANVNTVAFKSSSVTFQDILYQTTSGASGANVATGVGGVNAKQIGLGVSMASTSVSIETAGASETTGNPFDIKLTDKNTTNFFIVNDGSQNLFTRAGSFYVDGVGNLCMTSTGYTVMGWQVDQITNEIRKDTVTALRIMQERNLTSAPEATTNATMAGVLDENDSDVTSDAGKIMNLNFYDSLGYQYTARFSVKATGEEGKYEVSLTSILNDDNEDMIANYTAEEKAKLFGSFEEEDAPTTVELATATTNGASVNATTGAVTITVNGAQTQYTIANDKLVDANSNAMSDADLQKYFGAGAIDATVAYDATTQKYTFTQTKVIVEAKTEKVYTETDFADGIVGYNTDNKIVDDKGNTYTYDGGVNFLCSDGTTVTADKIFKMTENMQYYLGIGIGDKGLNINTDYEFKQDDDGQFVVTRKVPTYDLVFNTATGIFESINGDPESVTLKLGDAIGAGNFNQYGNFENISIDFTQCLNYNNSGKSTIGMDSGDVDGSTGKGRKLGNMIGVSIDTNGKIYGSYDNGNTELLGQIAVAQFSNAAGLEKVGESCYQTTLNSGEFDGIGVEIAADGSSMTTGELEMSNVDLSTEFTQMITTQRGFQANSRVITTSDTLLEELVNLKR
ncbi:MAG: flagellar hook-basal body complex protein [Lachnospiraceae bacterium]|nr:flagellar hook-basal body complex protein [Lachnospiraceae bacterium]